MRCKEHGYPLPCQFCESGLTQILHCDQCGEDYHADAPEHGHADECSWRINGMIWLYLKKHGPMSGQDICDALGVTEVDVTQAEIEGRIVKCDPLPGGVAPWYRVA
jgi:hypothetical protein